MRLLNEYSRVWDRACDRVLPCLLRRLGSARAVREASSGGRLWRCLLAGGEGTPGEVVKTLPESQGLDCLVFSFLGHSFSSADARAWDGEEGTPSKVANTLHESQDLDCLICAILGNASAYAGRRAGAGRWAGAAGGTARMSGRARCLGGSRRRSAAVCLGRCVPLPLNPEP